MAFGDDRTFQLMYVVQVPFSYFLEACTYDRFRRPVPPRKEVSVPSEVNDAPDEGPVSDRTAGERCVKEWRGR